MQEQGNNFVKMGKRAINQKALSDTNTSLLYSNRAPVNLLLGNYGRAILDSEEAINLSPTNVKVYLWSSYYIFVFLLFSL